MCLIAVSHLANSQHPPIVYLREYESLTKVSGHHVQVCPLNCVKLSSECTSQKLDDFQTEEERLNDILADIVQKREEAEASDHHGSDHQSDTGPRHRGSKPVLSSLLPPLISKLGLLFCCAFAFGIVRSICAHTQDWFEHTFPISSAPVCIVW